MRSVEEIQQEVPRLCGMTEAKTSKKKTEKMPTLVDDGRNAGPETLIEKIDRGRQEQMDRDDDDGEDDDRDIEEIMRHAGWKVNINKKKMRRSKGCWKSKLPTVTEEVRSFLTIEPSRVCSVETQGEWEVIDMGVDSGATETVVNEDMLQTIETKDGPAKKRGAEYEVANGERIPNLGEKKFIGMSEEGVERNMTAQVCDVNKSLLSVKKVVAAGNKVVFDEEGSHIEEKATGKRMWLREDNGMYMLKMWVKKSSGF